MKLHTILILHSFLLYHCVLGDSEVNSSFYEYFIKEAPSQSADYDASVEIETIPWVNTSSLKAATKFYDRNYIGVTLSHVYSLMEIFSLKTVSSILEQTGGYRNNLKAYRRMLKTFLHISMWMGSEDEMYRSGSTVYESLQTIRKRHSAAAEMYTNRTLSYISATVPFTASKEISALTRAIQADLAFVDTSQSPMNIINSWDFDVPVSQFAMGMVQFWFFGHIVMWPELFGIYLESPQEGEDFIHLWACLGRSLGIQDRFNVALNLPRDMYQSFYTNIIVASLKTVNERIVNNMDTYIKSYGDHFLSSLMGRIRCWLYYVLSKSVPGFKGTKILGLLDPYDKMCLAQLKAEGGPQDTRIINNNSKGRIIFTDWIKMEVEKLL